MRPGIFLMMVMVGITPLGAEQKVKQDVAVAFEQASSFEERSRLIEQVGRLDSVAAERLGRRLLGERAPGAEAIALRRLFLRGLGKNPGAFRGALAELGARDPDPGVRIAAIGALLAEASLVSMLDGDEWPEVRMEAANALAARGVRAPLVAVVWERAQPYDVRAHVARQLGRFADAALAQELDRRFLSVEEEAMTTEHAHPLFRQLIALFGRTRDARALPHLLRLAEHCPLAMLRGEAVLALSHTCTAEGRRAIERAKADPEREVALAGQRAAAVCKKGRSSAHQVSSPGLE